MNVTPEIERAIDLLAEAKTHFLLVTRTKVGTPERVREMGSLDRSTKEAREYIDGTLGGIAKIPRHLAIELRVCELGLERLGGPKAPPVGK